MDDGVKIAVDVYLPVGYPEGDRYPAILEMTRYWRNRGTGPSYLVRRAVNKGFAYVIMDERGTGASFGEWKTPLADRALRDAQEVMNWIVAQPWASGTIGATGVSYPGMAAQRLAALGHPALKAVVPMSDTYDQYEDLLFPGGLFNEAFLQGWSDLVYAMDRNPSVSVEGEAYTLVPVDSDPSGELMRQAIAGHGENLNAFQAVQGITFRDDEAIPGWTLDDISTHTRADDLAASEVAVYHWGSWLDGGSADGTIRAFMESPGPRRGTIGSWTHGLSQNAYTGLDRFPAVPSVEAQWDEALNFFDDVLRKGKPLQGRILRYFTMGENRWKATATWPVPGVTTERLYLLESGVLGPVAPSSALGEDLYEVDFEVLSAQESRWLSPLFADTWYPDRTQRDVELLVYQTPPLTEDLEVTGYPVVRLELASTHTDGAFIVYLEDVDSFGRVTYVTEGILRGIHRKTGQDPSAWKRPTPYHSYRAADAQPLVPGEVAELSFGLHPTSYLFRAGHRIRIAIAGHDASAFRRVPAEGTPVLRIQRNSAHSSYVDLPVVRNPE
jgi:putative CocE/NonD family hydrolase